MILIEKLVSEAINVSVSRKELTTCNLLHQSATNGVVLHLGRYGQFSVSDLLLTPHLMVYCGLIYKAVFGDLRFMQ